MVEGPIDAFKNVKMHLGVAIVLQLHRDFSRHFHQPHCPQKATRNQQPDMPTRRGHHLIPVMEAMTT
jgi:hypothetical protein